MDEGTFHVVEWTIDNFGCWNKDLHDASISSQSRTTPELSIELFPRGVDGRADHLLVRVRYSFARRLGGYAGDLAFVGSDGTTLCTQQVDSREEEALELPRGPKFEDVVARGDDRLTLRYRTRNTSRHSEYRRSTLDVFDASLKISTRPTSSPRISWLSYPLDEGGRVGQAIFIVSPSDDQDMVRLSLQPVSFVKRFWASVGVNGEGENGHLFLDGTPWEFSASIGEGSLLLHLRIVPANAFRQRWGLFQYQPEGVELVQQKERTPDRLTLTDRSVGVLATDLLGLYRDQEFSDLTLKCDGVAFPVHRAILSARSPVFKTMLSTDMTEAESGQVVIGDLDPSTLRLFLAFLYTGEVEDLQCDVALKLYHAADKYQVPSLKRECVDHLSGNVSVSNVCDVLSFATGFGDGELVGVAREFVLSNYCDVLSSEEWQSFMRSEPLLAVETVTQFAVKKYVGRTSS